MSSYDTTKWTGLTDNGVPYRLVDRSGEVERDSASFTEVYIIPSSRLLDFILVSFPPSKKNNPFAVFTNRQMPGVPNMLTRRLSIKSHVPGKPVDPFASDPTAPSNTYHPVLEVTITYSNEFEDQDENDPDTYLEIRGSTAGEFLQIGAANASWVSGNTTESNDIPSGVTSSVIVSETEWTVTWTQIPKDFFRSTLIGRLREILGKVNSDVNELLFDAPAETLLFVGFEYAEERKRFLQDETEVIFDPDTEETQTNLIRKSERFITLTAKFLEKHIKLRDGTIAGHNHYWRENGGWQKLQITKTDQNGEYTDTIYETAPFSDIFKPDEDDA